MNHLCSSVAGRKSSLAGGRHRDTSAREGRSSRVSTALSALSDGKEFSAPRSPSNVLVYKEVNGLDSDLFFGFTECREIYLWI